MRVRSICLMVIALCGGPLLAADAPSPAAPMIKLLQSGRVPAERLGAIVDMVGKRGDAGDLAYLLGQALKADGFPEAARLQALQSLADAASSRNVTPTGDLAGLAALVGAPKGVSPATELAAIRLAGLWKVSTLAEALEKIALDKSNSDKASTATRRQAALDALARIGGENAKSTFDNLMANDQPHAVRVLGAAGLARLDLEAGSKRAVEILAAGGDTGDPAPLIDAFLSQKGGADRLAAELKSARLSKDLAKIALRHLYSVGRADAALVSVLSDAAEIAADVPPPTPEEVQKLVAEVAEKGDAARGEQVFRSASLSCFKCHAVGGAGGNVGPELSAVGSTGPPDYVITSLLQPELSVKEQYQLATVATGDGRIVQGIIVEENVDVLVLKDADGRVVRIARDEDDAIKKGGSLMPKGLANFMTHGEFLDLVKFVSQLGKPGEYAVRSRPTIQKWRYLSPLSEKLASGVPDPDTFQVEVLAADDTAWRPAYAKVAGALPLAEVVTAAKSPVLYLQAGIDVTVGGPVGLMTNLPASVPMWIEGKPLGADDRQHFQLERGLHKLTVRLDTARDTLPELTAELTRPEGSTAEFTVVGGS